MRIALVAPYPYYARGVEGTVYPPLGVLYVAAAVRPLAEALCVLDANALRLGVAATVERLASFKPDVVGLSANVVTARAAREVAAAARAALPGATLVAGGPLPTAFPRRWLPHVDAVVVGEGEAAFSELVRWLDAGHPLAACPAAGVVAAAADPVAAPAAAAPADPDGLPLPAYDALVPPLAHYTRAARVVRPLMAPLLTSRGCPYQCGFCDKGVHGSRFRPRSPRAVLDEVAWLRADLGVNQVDILDDNFTLDAARAEEILDGLARHGRGTAGRLAINCHNGLRADRLTPALVDKMRRAGVFKAGIGVESGSPAVLARIHKALDLDQARRAIKWLRQAGITVHGFFIIGFPFETREDLDATLRFARAADPHFANYSFFLPVAGTALYDELKRSGRLLRDSVDGIESGFFRGEPYAALDHLTAGEIEEWYGRAWRSFYLRPRKALDIVRTLRSWSELRWVARVGWSVARRGLFGFGRPRRPAAEPAAGAGGAGGERGE